MITANAYKVCALAHERRVVTYAKAPMRRGSLDPIRYRENRIENAALEVSELC
jgi:hypothetical protein